MVEWQSESSLFTLRVRGKQWYWVYKYDLKIVTDVLTAPKNIGNNKWVISNPLDLQVADDYLHIHQLRAQSAWVAAYWETYKETDLYTLTNSKENSAFVSSHDFYKKYVKANWDKNFIQIFNPYQVNLGLNSLWSKFKSETTSPTSEQYLSRFLSVEELGLDFDYSKEDVYKINKRVEPFFLGNFKSEHAVKMLPKCFSKKTLPNLVEFKNTPIKDIYVGTVPTDSYSLRINNMFSDIDNNISRKYKNNLESFELKKPQIELELFEKNKDVEDFIFPVQIKEIFLNPEKYKTMREVTPVKTVDSKTLKDLFFKFRDSVYYENFLSEEPLLSPTTMEDTLKGFIDTRKLIENTLRLNAYLDAPAPLVQGHFLFELLRYNSGIMNIRDGLFLYNDSSEYFKNYYPDLNAFVDVRRSDFRVAPAYSFFKINSPFYKNVIANSTQFSGFDYNADHEWILNSVFEEFNPHKTYTNHFSNFNDWGFFNIAGQFIEEEDFDNDYIIKLEPEDYISAMDAIGDFLKFPFESNKGLTFGHSQSHETAYYAQKGQSIQTPMRLIKYPLNYIKDNQDSDLIELFRIRFGEGKHNVEQKTNTHQTYWIFRQKRYKRVGFVKNRFRYYMDWQGRKTTRAYLSYQPYVVKNRLVLADRKSHMTHYELIKTSRRRHENISLPFYKRLLRTRRLVVLPANINITVITNSFDVVHSWFIPGLGLKLDCIPGRSTHHVLHIDNVGFYYGQCAEICGRYHHHMPIRICALPFEHFMVWWNAFAMPRLLKIHEDPYSVDKKLRYLYSFNKYVW